jgi:hypothetical protein
MRRRFRKERCHLRDCETPFELMKMCVQIYFMMALRFRKMCRG